MAANTMSESNPPAVDATLQHMHWAKAQHCPLPCVCPAATNKRAARLVGVCLSSGNVMHHTCHTGCIEAMRVTGSGAHQRGAHQQACDAQNYTQQLPRRSIPMWLGWRIAQPAKHSDAHAAVDCDTTTAGQDVHERRAVHGQQQTHAASSTT